MFAKPDAVSMNKVPTTADVQISLYRALMERNSSAWVSSVT